ncbi:N-acetylmuramoyl-L-alanine amidase [Siminovitchia terrae]|uniref:N-acetylmuramoyl-L-alanine amidase n=1 Tax=Siminovitchia terrae TaxID=1914933 RepID=UPI0028B0D7CD|nr:N-acetylmuramoyl-L-alanine amidase [Siminovitchia terrae]
MNIIQRIIPKGQKNQRPGFSMTPKYITVHQTANKSKGANAEMHARYLLNGGGGRVVGWHFTVDDHYIYQHLPCNESGWHAGDGSGPGNRQSIGIEICENVDGDFQKAVKNAQWLIMKLMTDHGISADCVVPHKHWSGKNCPSTLLLGWQTFKDGLKSGTSKPLDKPAASKPAANNKPANKPSGAYTDGSIVDYLKSIGQDSSFSNRAKLSAQHGIKNYKGTEKQNLELLNKLRTDKPTASKPKGNMQTGSIVDYLKSINQDSSFANRKKLAAKYKIENYKGTPIQNTQLLKKLRG